MKTLLAPLAALVLIGMLCAPAMAQHPYANMREFFQTHPNDAAALQANPSLIDNPQWVRNHPQLHEFLQSHPNARVDFKSNPYGFMNREEGRRGGGNAYVNTENFMRNHPEVERQLQANPALADNPNYVRNHPGLQEFLANHPQARRDLRNHPYATMNRAERHPNNRTEWNGH